MKKVFIVDQYQHARLLHFTQAKVMFNAKNQYTTWADDIVTVPDIESVGHQAGVVIASGDIVTTNFRSRPWDWQQTNIQLHDSDLIKFDADYSYQMHQRPPFESGSKQLYILENLYRVVLRSSKLIYIDNTETYEPRSLTGSVLYGLASGWKTVRMFRDGNFERVIVYDKNQTQLDYQQRLHSQPYIADQLDIQGDVVGSRTVPKDIQDFWPSWHRMKVEFKLIDLFHTPVLEEHSVIWVSNVFCYEPTIFQQGWEACKLARVSLQNANPSCTILEY
jgi:hypothetical protein